MTHTSALTAAIIIYADLLSRAFRENEDLGLVIIGIEKIVNFNYQVRIRDLSLRVTGLSLEKMNLGIVSDKEDLSIPEFS